jgi:hypothetical protein
MTLYETERDSSRHRRRGRRLGGGIGDRYRAEARWVSGAELSTLNGRAVKVKFHIQGADLCSYWVT